METLNEEMLVLLNDMHEDPKIFTGTSLKRHKNRIRKIMKENDLDTILDYGCGKAKHHPKNWNIAKYDPGYPPFSEKPVGQFDMVICTDVLEHIEEEFIDAALDDIYNYAKHYVFLNIATQPAVKVLADGRNAHVTVKSKKWWKEKLDKYPIRTYISFD